MSSGFSKFNKSLKPVPGGGRELWNAEYGLHRSIPSSSRMIASKPFLLYDTIIGYERMSTVLDAGCGLGRNSIYMARKGSKVQAVDYSDVALGELQRAVLRLGLSNQIEIRNTVLDESFPFADASFDLTIDSYVSCHFIDDEFRNSYRNELCRVTKTGGVVFSSLFSFDDEYYKDLQKRSENQSNLVTDPTNGITKRLFDEKEIKTFYSVCFEVLYFTKFEFTDIVLGDKYKRSIFAIALRK